MIGIFDLTEPRHLLEKMGRELDRLRSKPDDVDHAFNFFTTAEHMLDWLHPGYTKAARSQRESFRKDPLIATVSHLASGAKHFDKLSAHHDSVIDTDRKGGFWAAGFWASRFWASGFWAGPRLTITLSEEAASFLGTTSITALALAERVYSYWSDRFREAASN